MSIALFLLLLVTSTGLTQAHDARGCAAPASEVIARRLRPGKSAPTERDWSAARPISFCADWQGRNADPQRATEIRVIWSPDTLYIRFVARYRELYTYSRSNTRVNKLWERDVAEVFLQPPPNAQHSYKEFEISPNGNWMDLDIASGAAKDLRCPLKAVASVDEQSRTWTGVLSISMQCLTPQFEPAAVWRVNFFRVEGREPQRFYSSWRPTHTQRPNFHVPEVFGTLRFRK